MVRYQANPGNADTRRTARAKHPVLFDLPADRGVELKKAFPDLGWVPSLEGFPTLPFSIAGRLLLPYGAERDGRETALFAEFPTDQYLARAWAAVAPKVNMGADSLFAEVDRVFKDLEDQSPFIFIAGDWEAAEGELNHDEVEWEGHARWIDCITRGDAFKATPAHTSGLAAAELLYYVGPYMLTDQREEEGCHFLVAAKTLGSYFQSSADEELCDGAQLSSEIADGLADSAWPELFMHITEGSDSVSDPTARGGPRISEIRLRVGYHEASTLDDASTTKYLTRVLPHTIKHSRALPLISVIFHLVTNGPSIAEGLVKIAAALGMPSPRRIDDLSLRQMEELLTPISSIVNGSAIANDVPHHRITSVLAEIESKHLCAKSSLSANPS